MTRAARWVIGAVGIVALIVAGGVLVRSWSEADNIVHPARKAVALTPAEFGAAYEEVAFDTEDGIRIRGWWLPPENPPAAAVIVQPGHNSIRADVITHTLMMASHGYGVLSFDWRANGESGGEMATLGLLEANDARAALNWLEARPDVDPGRIGALGQSAGAAALIYAAADDRRIAALVAETPFASVRDIVDSGVESVTGLPAFPFAQLIALFAQTMTGHSMGENRPVDSIGRIAPRPVLLIRAGEDTLTLPPNADQLFAAAGEPKELWDVPGALHSKALQADPAGYEAKVVGFFDDALQGVR